MKTLKAYISFRQLQAPWVRVFAERQMCPVHQKVEYPGSCPFLAVLVAPQDADVVITDVGSRYTDPTELNGWVCIGGKATGGGGHNSYTYVRANTQIGKEIVEWALRGHPASSVYEIQETRDGFVVYTTSPGPWIGRGGRWVKAYRKLGINVQIREATLVNLSEMPSESREQIREKSLWVRKIETRMNVTIGALVPGKNDGLPPVHEVVRVRSSETA